MSSKIAVYGASGFTGGLVTAELHRRGLSPILIGRDRARLTESAPPGAEIRVAGLDEPHALAAAFRGLDVVINCVAPFTVWGERVLRGAISAGATYLDTNGEQDYLARIFAGYGEAPTTIVPMVNDGGFLADLLAGLTADGPVDELRLVHETTGSALSRGSGRTALANLDSFTGGGLVYVDGTWRRDVPREDPPGLTRFAMPEIITVPRHVRARRVEAFGKSALLRRFTAVTPEIVETLPETRSEEARRSVHFGLTVDADGRRGTITGTDTYGTTAQVAAEVAIRVAGNGAPAGVLTPWQAVEPRDLLDSLDVSWAVG
ncbi:NAD(P)H-binding protein [Amycolatopsis sp.]|uniref:NAD(P)H-binding protein n=1 Tax=Amycolatopsis sp. TaxID=37632 RepID=UPI002CDDD258|nr:NAD(P)H-binding protein [Amycolatopsis sp.]HVV12967.1 NAD(P)H-binding protein [Amycolatopsis sp.]